MARPPRDSVISGPQPEPVFNIPAVLLVLLGLMIGIQTLRSALSPWWTSELLAHLAFVPGRLTCAWSPGRIMTALARLGAGGGPDARDAASEGLFFLGNCSPQPWTVLTYAFLHGGWAHLGLNGVWFLAFGAPVARRFGFLRFLAFFALGAVVGAATHYAVFPDSPQPLVGASASVSACMAAALRFMVAAPDPERDSHGPRHRRASTSIATMLHDRRALSFLVVWLVTNVITGVGSFTPGSTDAPIAWQAHIGGFLFGLLTFRLFDR